VGDYSCATRELSKLKKEPKTMATSLASNFEYSVADCEDALLKLSNFALSYRDKVEQPFQTLTYDFECRTGRALFANLLDTFAESLGVMRGSKTIPEALANFYTAEALERLYRVQTRYWFWTVVGHTASDYYYRAGTQVAAVPLDLEVVNYVLGNVRQGRLAELHKMPRVLEELARGGIVGLSTSSLLALVALGIVTISPTSGGEMKPVLNGIFDDESQLLA
jgi:hypothetical protein